MPKILLGIVLRREETRKDARRAEPRLLQAKSACLSFQANFPCGCLVR